MLKVNDQCKTVNPIISRDQRKIFHSSEIIATTYFTTNYVQTKESYNEILFCLKIINVSPLGTEIKVTFEKEKMELIERFSQNSEL